MRLEVDGFTDRRLSLVPEPWRGRVQRGHARRLAKADAVPPGRGLRTLAEQAANAWLIDTTSIFERIRLPLGVSDGDIRERAAECAKQALSLAEIAPGVFVPSVADLRARLARFVGTYGALPPGESVEDGPAVRRMTCPNWWRRALRVAQARQLEFGAVALGYVHRSAEIYASDATVLRRQEQRRRNAATLEQTKALNLDTGDEYTLAELAAVSVANPAIRRGELMTRIAGFESVAKGLGHIAEFVTLTTPSRFHRMRKTDAGKVVRNVRYDGSTPRDAQKYLVGVWAKIRAKLARMGLRCYGFRIAEPHHDATPHWHLLLFMGCELREGVRALPRFRAVFRRYALKDSGKEPGAKKYRVKFEAIDWARGTAAGYVLKYVAKNIDGNGYEVQGDLEAGRDAIVPTQRVEAWASTWGIRQFQQIGGPPVGVWRELRRMREETAGPDVLESARSAADVGNWGRYVEVMGGPVVARAALPLRAAYTEPGERINTRTGEVIAGRMNAYGEPCAPAVYGVRYWETVERCLGLAVWRERVQTVAASVRYSWEIKRGGSDAGKGKGFSVGRGAGGDGCRVGGGADRGGVESGGGLGFEGVGEARATRTRVNNCTRGSDFQPAGSFCFIDWDWKKGDLSNDAGSESKKGGGTGERGDEFAAFRGGAKGKGGGSGHGGRAGSHGA